MRPTGKNAFSVMLDKGNALARKTLPQAKWLSSSLKIPLDRPGSGCYAGRILMKLTEQIRGLFVFKSSPEDLTNQAESFTINP